MLCHPPILHVQFCPTGGMDSRYMTLTCLGGLCACLTIIQGLSTGIFYCILIIKRCHSSHKNQLSRGYTQISASSIAATIQRIGAQTTRPNTMNDAALGGTCRYPQARASGMSNECLPRREFDTPSRQRPFERQAYVPGSYKAWCEVSDAGCYCPSQSPTLSRRSLPCRTQRLRRT